MSILGHALFAAIVIGAVLLAAVGHVPGVEACWPLCEVPR